MQGSPRKTLRPPTQGTRSIFSDSATTLMRSTVIWSIPKSQRFHSQASATSAVPHYFHKSTLNPHGPSIGHSRRLSFQPSDFPGPDAYQTQPHTSRSTAINKHNRKLGYLEQVLHSTRNVPGPGAYQITSTASTTAATLKGKFANTSPHKDLPGPGEYNPRTDTTIRKVTRSIRIGSGGRSDFTKIQQSVNPGPGAYNLPSKFNKKPRIKH